MGAWWRSTTAARSLTAASLEETLDEGLVTLVLDHRFFFAIGDNQTGLLLFIGLVLDPTQQ